MAEANSTFIGAPIKAVGGALSAPLGTALPTDAKTPLAPEFRALGLIGEDGVSEAETRDTEVIRAWGGTVARIMQTEYGIEVTMTFLERTDEVLKEVRGQNNVSTSGDTRTVLRNSEPLEQRSYVLEIKDGSKSLRVVYPIAQVSSVGDVTYAHSDLIRYEVTLQCFEDESGQTAYEYETI